MSKLNILTYPDPFLKTKARAVESVGEAEQSLIEDMVETMYGARGIGLAATQVGVDKRIIILDVPDETTEDSDTNDGEVFEEGRSRGRSIKEDRPSEEAKRGGNLLKLINPEIINSSGSIVYEEGCLSVPGVNADVKRAGEVTVRALNQDGEQFEIEASGLLAVAFQHEIDHLDGILFIEHLGRIKRNLIKRRLRKIAAEELESA